MNLTVTGNEAALAALRDGMGDLAASFDDSGLELADVTLRQEAGDPGRGQNRGEPDGSGLFRPGEGAGEQGTRRGPRGPDGPRPADTRPSGEENRPFTPARARPGTSDRPGTFDVRI